MKVRILHIDYEGDETGALEAMRMIAGRLAGAPAAFVETKPAPQLTAPADAAPESSKGGRSPAAIAKQKATLAAKRASSAVARIVGTNGKPKEKSLEDLRREREDKAVGILCDQCGYEPPAPDRRKRCPKCNAKRWASKAPGPLAIADVDESDEN